MLVVLEKKKRERKKSGTRQIAEVLETCCDDPQSLLFLPDALPRVPASFTRFVKGGAIFQ